MVIFEGKYSWPGERKTYSKPVSWWPGCYRLKIVDLSEENPGVRLLKPYLCLLEDTGEGFRVGSGFPNLADSICEEFSLEMGKVLWVEYFPSQGKDMEVAMLKPEIIIGSKTLYSVKWRPALANERKVIAPHLPGK